SMFIFIPYATHDQAQYGTRITVMSSLDLSQSGFFAQIDSRSFQNRVGSVWKATTLTSGIGSAASIRYRLDALS
ncbi:MAG: hypothetical protein ACKO96_07270, partial [Flammeovirgaceae bacterium]